MMNSKVKKMIVAYLKRSSEGLSRFTKILWNDGRVYSEFFAKA
jgi:hypothetical protein